MGARDDTMRDNILTDARPARNSIPLFPLYAHHGSHCPHHPVQVRRRDVCVCVRSVRVYACPASPVHLFLFTSISMALYYYKKRAYV